MRDYDYYETLWNDLVVDVIGVQMAWYNGDYNYLVTFHIAPAGPIRTMPTGFKHSQFVALRVEGKRTEQSLEALQ